MLVKVYGAAIHGVSAQIITIEVNVDTGVGYHLVGLPDNAIKESSYRISAALKNSGFKNVIFSISFLLVLIQQNQYI